MIIVPCVGLHSEGYKWFLRNLIQSGSGFATNTRVSIAHLATLISVTSLCLIVSDTLILIWAGDICRRQKIYIGLCIFSEGLLLAGRAANNPVLPCPLQKQKMWLCLNSPGSYLATTPHFTFLFTSHPGFNLWSLLLPVSSLL